MKKSTVRKKTRKPPARKATSTAGAVKKARKSPSRSGTKAKAVKTAAPKAGVAKKAARRAAKKAPVSRKAAQAGRAAKPKTVKAKKRAAAVERLLAMQANKAQQPSAKREFLIKAPKKAKQGNLVTTPRFVRRVAASAPVEASPKPVARKGKTVLRRKMVEELRQALDAERQRLVAQLAALDEIASLKGPSDVNDDIPGYSIHLAEYASDNQIVETTLAQRALQAERLAEIEQALRRIGQPGYGICEMCGCPIALERLKIKPFAALCVRCREMKERGMV